eukprot:5251640-Amphidinium_carterae.2
MRVDISADTAVQSQTCTYQMHERRFQSRSLASQVAKPHNPSNPAFLPEVWRPQASIFLGIFSSDICHPVQMVTPLSAD